MTDILQSRYYQINKFALSSMGLWLYQSRRQRFLLLALQVCHVLVQFPAQIIVTVKCWDDPKVISEMTMAYLATIAFLIRLMPLIMNSDKISEGFRRIEINWILATEQEEIHIFRNYAEEGRQLAIAYAVGMSFIMALFMIEPFVPRILKLMKPTNETLPKILPFQFDYYGLKIDTYYYYLLTFEYLAIIHFLLVFIAADTMILMHLQHACGLFAIVSHQVQRIGNYITEECVKYSHPKLDPAFRHLTICIEKHRHAVESSESQNASYTWILFICIGTGMLSLSYAGVKTVSLMEISPNGAVSYGAQGIAIIIMMFIGCFFAQRLLDHSQQISEYLCQVEWYKTSLVTQKLFILLIMRSHVPCRVTAGKFMALTIENYTLLLKTCFSYFTLMRSMH